MTDAEILATVTDIARRAVGYDGAISTDQRLVEDLRLDSIRALTLAVEVENHFRIVIPPEAEASIATVGDLVRVIREALHEPE
jgi:acyl carrier protein